MTRSHLHLIPFLRRVVVAYLCIGLSIVLHAQEVSAIPGTLSSPYRPTGQQIQLIAYHHTASDGVKPTLTFEIAPGEKIYAYTTSFQEAQLVASAIYSGTTAQVPDAMLDCGYFVADPSQLTMAKRFYWIFDYSKVSLSSIALQADYDSRQPCQFVSLQLSRPLPKIEYVSPAGIRQEADRGLLIAYQDQVYNVESHRFDLTNRKETMPHTSEATLRLVAPLADTDFAISGDRFTTDVEALYGLPIRSNALQAHRVELHARYTLRDDHSDSPAREEESATIPSTLSAPATIDVSLVANDPAAMIYQIVIVEGTVATPEAPLVMQYNGSAAQHTFDKMGSYTIYGKVADRTASCSAESEPLVVSIQSSRLEIPNVFTPFSSPGVNDQFKVVHQSLVSFDACIYDSWGGLIYRWSDPNGGWDGTRHGRPVPGGVYYYVITAEGADGISYHESGDINILESDYSQQPQP